METITSVVAGEDNRRSCRLRFCPVAFARHARAAWGAGLSQGCDVTTSVSAASTLSPRQVTVAPVRLKRTGATALIREGGGDEPLGSLIALLDDGRIGRRDLAEDRIRPVLSVALVERPHRGGGV